MNSLILECGDALPFPADPPESFADEARFLLALKLFELGRITSGKAGRLCNMGRIEFLLAAGRAGVPLINLVTVQQHRICVVISLLMGTSTRRRLLPSSCGTAERLHFRVDSRFFRSW